MRRLTPALVLAFATPVFADPPAARQASVTTGSDDDNKVVPATDARRTPSYHGVTPGQDGPPPPSSKFPRGKSGPRLTWVGFNLRAGVPTVFVQLSAPVAWSLAADKGQLVYSLVGATVPLANNRRPLQVQEFGTAVKTVTARQRGRDVEVTIELSGPVAHVERIESAAGGMKFLVIELRPPT